MNPIEKRSAGSVRASMPTYQAKPVATMRMPMRLPGFRYQAKRPAPTKPSPITREAAIQRPGSSPKSALAIP